MLEKEQSRICSVVLATQDFFNFLHFFRFYWEIEEGYKKD